MIPGRPAGHVRGPAASLPLVVSTLAASPPNSRRQTGADAEPTRAGRCSPANPMLATRTCVRFSRAGSWRRISPQQTRRGSISPTRRTVPFTETVISTFAAHLPRRPPWPAHAGMRTLTRAPTEVAAIVRRRDRRSPIWDARFYGRSRPDRLADDRGPTSAENLTGSRPRPQAAAPDISATHNNTQPDVRRRGNRSFDATVAATDARA